MDPLRFLYDAPSLKKRRINQDNRAAIIERHDALAMSVRTISRHELRVWFEPDWGAARWLATRFPHCLIVSIPVESNTPNLTKTPGWRLRKSNNAFV
jgi:hypothetical protein